MSSPTKRQKESQNKNLDIPQNSCIFFTVEKAYPSPKGAVTFRHAWLSPHLSSRHHPRITDIPQISC